MRFEEILVAATGITCVSWLASAYVFKLDKENTFRKQSKSFFQIFLIVLILRSFIAEPFRIPSGSMKPTLYEGDFILVDKISYGVRLPISGKIIVPVRKPKRGEILVFRQYDKDVIKRIVGLPGDEVEYKNKTIYINGKEVEKTFVTKDNDDFYTVDNFSEKLGDKIHGLFNNPMVPNDLKYPYDVVKVPANSYFCIGDNRDNSNDGRYWGFVSDKDIIGRAIFIWFNFKNWYIKFSRIGNVL